MTFSYIVIDERILNEFKVTIVWQSLMTVLIACEVSSAKYR